MRCDSSHVQLENVAQQNVELYQQLISIMLPEEYTSQEDTYVPPILNLHASNPVWSLPTANLVGDNDEIQQLHEVNQTLKTKIASIERELRQV
jgi:hypothetical protein